MTFHHFGIIGAGSWGTALALVAAQAGRKVSLWARDPTHAADMAITHANTRHLSGLTLPPAITPTCEPNALRDADVILLATPAQTIRSIAGLFANIPAKTCPAVICAKGIEFGSGASMSEVVAEVMPGRCIAVLSGPTFAGEVARGLPTAVTLACAQIDVAERLTESLATPTFRPYFSDDVIGVEIAGALKNVIAIACGILVGRGLGENARASLITRGLVEIQRLAVAKGGRAATVMGLGGVGDLMLSCASTQSRNFAFGKLIGEGMPVAEALARPDIIVEGVHTARAIPRLAQAMAVDLPICAAVANVLHEGSDIDREMANLLSRPLREEGLRH